MELYYRLMQSIGANVYILTYRNNPSYISMVILIFPSVRSNTAQIRMKLRPCNSNLMCSSNHIKAQYRVTETSTSNFERLFISKK